MNGVLDKIKKEEGFRADMYQCCEGFNTIGIGFNLDAIKMPEEVADLWLTLIVNELSGKMMRYEWFKMLSNARKICIIDMTYQLGINGVLNFKNMISAIEQANFALASFEMLDSRWAKQTPNRATRNAEIMRSGKYE